MGLTALAPYIGPETAGVLTPTMLPHPLLATTKSPRLASTSGHCHVVPLPQDSYFMCFFTFRFIIIFNDAFPDHPIENHHHSVPNTTSTTWSFTLLFQKKINVFLPLVAKQKQQTDLKVHPAHRNLFSISFCVCEFRVGSTHFHIRPGGLLSAFLASTLEGLPGRCLRCTTHGLSTGLGARSSQKSELWSEGTYSNNLENIQARGRITIQDTKRGKYPLINEEKPCLGRKQWRTARWSLCLGPAWMLFFASDCISHNTVSGHCPLLAGTFSLGSF